MVINFGAGPAKLPEEVLEKVQKNLLNVNNSGISVMEMSHRSKNYAVIHDGAINLINELLNIPKNYRVLFMQGGGQGQFAAVCLNLIGRTGSADYIVTGSWSAKAAKEAQKYGKVNLVLPETKQFTKIPEQNTWKLSSNASYVYYCDNETVDGIEFNFVPTMLEGVPLVCDMSSNFLTRSIDVTKFGVIFACAQKNIGPAGTTVVIIREDLLGHEMKQTPSVLNFSIMNKENSLYNTPPTFGIYVIGQVLEWIKEKGGVNCMQKNSDTKSKLLYDVIDKSNGFFVCPAQADCRSRVTIPFRIGNAKGDDALEKEFLEKCESIGMIQLKGHRSVGGIRASLYNALTINETQQLIEVMLEFHKNKIANKK